MNPTPALERLTDQALLCQFSELVHEDNHHTANLLRHIDAIDRRQRSEGLVRCSRSQAALK